MVLDRSGATVGLLTHNAVQRALRSGGSRAAQITAASACLAAGCAPHARRLPASGRLGMRRQAARA